MICVSSFEFTTQREIELFCGWLIIRLSPIASFTAHGRTHSRGHKLSVPRVHLSLKSSMYIEQISGDPKSGFMCTVEVDDDFQEPESSKYVCTLKIAP